MKYLRKFKLFEDFEMDDIDINTIKDVFQEIIDDYNLESCDNAALVEWDQCGLYYSITKSLFRNNRVNFSISYRCDKFRDLFLSINANNCINRLILMGYVVADKGIYKPPDNTGKFINFRIYTQPPENTVLVE